MSLLYAIILIGVLIFVHELGHFIFAKVFDVKVLRFSIGFGPRIFGFTKGETEYVVCWLPLGGYVKMLGFDFDSLERIPEEEKDRALMAKPVWKRSIITLAGPAFNFIFPLFVYFLVSMGQATAPPSMVGEVLAETPAERGGLKSGDRVVQINGEEVKYWHEVTDYASNQYQDPLDIVVKRGSERKNFKIKPEVRSNTDFLGVRQSTYGFLGVQLGTHGTTIAVPDQDSPAAEAGLETFDRIVAVDGKTLKTYHALNRTLKNHRGKSTNLTVLERAPVNLSYGQFFTQEKSDITLEVPEKVNTKSLGLEPAGMYLSRVKENSAAAEAGLKPGDKILQMDGRRYNNFNLLNEKLQNQINKFLLEEYQKEDPDISKAPSFEIQYQRGGELRETTIDPNITRFEGRGNQEQYDISIGWANLTDHVRPDDVPFPFGERMAFSASYSLEKTWGVVETMVRGLVRMAEGRVGLDTVGGPLAIGELAAEAGRAGWEPFVQMMALISINLGIINLLPIPVLDGGHLVLYLIEAIKRGPLSYRTRQIAAYIGIALLLFLMLLAFKNDLERYWEDIAYYIRNI